MNTMKMKGYSILEVLIAICILTGLVMASCSVFESGSRALLKAQSRMVAARMVEQISEALHAMPSSAITNLADVPFPRPFGAYLYSIDVSPYPGLFFLNNVTKISGTVTGPVAPDGSVTYQTTSIHFLVLLARQPYHH